MVSEAKEQFQAYYKNGKKARSQFAHPHQRKRQSDRQNGRTHPPQDSSEVLKCHVPSEPNPGCAVPVLISGLILELSALSDRAHLFSESQVPLKKKKSKCGNLF